MDFTLKAYDGILTAGLAAGYTAQAVTDALNPSEGSAPERVMVLRHDVDRRPANAVAMARLEADMGIRSSYFFRIIKETFRPEMMREIAAMGHEVGYHYEDFHLAKYDPAEAHRLYLMHLAQLREIVSVQTICMHGSPLAKFNNMEIWKYHDFTTSGVQDCILSADWSDYTFFTDTGRSFAAGKTNLRDEVGGRKDLSVKSSKNLERFLSEHRNPRVQISTHPERWNAALWPWARQLVVDTGVNTIKLGLSLVR